MALSTGSFLGTLALFVYFGTVVLSVPAAAATLLLSRRLGVLPAAVGVVLATGGLVLAAAILGSGVLGVQRSLAAASVGVVGLLVLWVVPVALGTAIVRRFAGPALAGALGFTVAGLPPALLASAVVFVAPGGPSRYNLTFLAGPALWAASAVFLTIVLLGPGLAGLGLHRLVGSRRR